jgi:hypothetical protein
MRLGQQCDDDLGVAPGRSGEPDPGVAAVARLFDVAGEEDAALARLLGELEQLARARRARLALADVPAATLKAALLLRREGPR